MHGNAVLLIVPLAFFLAMGGCLGGDGDERGTTPVGGFPENPGDGDPDPGGNDGDGEDVGEEDDPEADPRDPQGEPDDPVGGEDPAEGDERPCHDHDPSRPVPPSQQQVDDAADVRCPGHYAILDAGEGETLPVPSWSTGDWWSYENQFMDHPPTQLKETVNGTGTAWDVPVYEMFVQEWDADGEPDDARESHRTVDSLMQPQIGGAINHELLFPLAENKSWVYMTGGRATVTATVQYEPDYVFQGENKTVWHVELFIQRESGQETIKKLWFCEEAGNVLEEEVWGAQGGTATIRTLVSTLIDHGPAP